MSVETTLLSRTMTLSVNNGGDSVKNRTFSPVNPSATDDQLYNAAAALGGLMDNTVERIVYSDRNLLTEVEEQEG